MAVNSDTQLSAGSESAPDAQAVSILVQARHRQLKANDALGKWMSAALDDPSVCTEMKMDVLEWFEAHQSAAAELVQSSPDADEWEKRIREKVFNSKILTEGEWVYLIGLFHTAREADEIQSPNDAQPVVELAACPWCGFENGHHPWCRSPGQPTDASQPPAAPVETILPGAEHPENYRKAFSPCSAGNGGDK